jgi:hypothetical protein
VRGRDVEVCLQGETDEEEHPGSDARARRATGGVGRRLQHPHGRRQVEAAEAQVAGWGIERAVRVEKHRGERERGIERAAAQEVLDLPPRPLGRPRPDLDERAVAVATPVAVRDLGQGGLLAGRGRRGEEHPEGGGERQHAGDGAGGQRHVAPPGHRV